MFYVIVYTWLWLQIHLTWNLNAIPSSASSNETKYDVGIFTHEKDLAICKRMKEKLEELHYKISAFENFGFGKSLQQRTVEFIKACDCIFWVATKTSIEDGKSSFFRDTAQNEAIKTSKTPTFFIVLPREDLDLNLPWELDAYLPLKENQNFEENVRESLNRISNNSGMNQIPSTSSPVSHNQISSPSPLPPYAELKPATDSNGIPPLGEGSPTTIYNFSIQGSSVGNIVFGNQEKMEDGNMIPSMPTSESTAAPILISESTLQATDRSMQPDPESSSNKKQDGKKGRRIMLSYNQGESSTMAKLIYDKLNIDGYSPWMDVEDSLRNLDKDIAAAIEDAYAVLVFVTKGYEESEICHRELVHAINRKKEIFFIKHNDYQPKEWLQFEMENAKYYNFATLDFNTKYQELRKDIDKFATCYRIE